MLTLIHYYDVYGEMSELAEGARLEIACTTKSGTGGSNPPLSAMPIVEHPLLIQDAFGFERFLLS